jgi:hypothetical protein
MSTRRLQELAKRAKIGFLQWRINRALRRFDKARVLTPECGRAWLKLSTLIHMRNSLRTPADVAQIEKERGLV